MFSNFQWLQLPWFSQSESSFIPLLETEETSNKHTCQNQLHENCGCSCKMLSTTKLLACFACMKVKVRVWWSWWTWPSLTVKCLKIIREWSSTGVGMRLPVTFAYFVLFKDTLGRFSWKNKSYEMYINLKWTICYPSDLNHYL